MFKLSHCYIVSADTLSIWCQLFWRWRCSLDTR